MDIIKITFGTGYFALNGEMFPRGQYRIQIQGERVNILNINNQITFTALRSQFVNSLDVPFDTIDELKSEFTSAFNIGGGDGEGVTGTERESNTVIFDGDYVIGNAAPRTGDIIFDFTQGRELLSSTMMIHQDANPFIIPGIVLSGEPLPNAVNYIYFLLVDAGVGTEKVHVTISQEQI